MPQAHAGEAVGVIFLAAAYFGCLRPNHDKPPSHYGLTLGGIFEPQPLSPLRILRDSAQAFLIATTIACIILPPFWLGFLHWYQPRAEFSWVSALRGDASHPALGLLNLSLAHLLVVALPEEVFFRGYLQTALTNRYPHGKRLLSVSWSTGLVLSSVLFALGHVTTAPHVGRLAVFFPSLLFGILRDKTKGVGSSIILHAQCNVFAALLGQGYGLY